MWVEARPQRKSFKGMRSGGKAQSVSTDHVPSTGWVQGHFPLFISLDPHRPSRWAVGARSINMTVLWRTEIIGWEVICSLTVDLRFELRFGGLYSQSHTPLPSTVVPSDTFSPESPSEPASLVNRSQASRLGLSFLSCYELVYPPENPYFSTL